VGRTPLRQISKHLNNKNAIMPEIGGPPWQFFLKPLTPLGILAKKHQVPPPLDFQPMCIYGSSIELFFLPTKVPTGYKNIFEGTMFKGKLQITSNSKN
jgi:hypothetical protein